jgi:hypothetical protein
MRDEDLATGAGAPIGVVALLNWPTGPALSRAGVEGEDGEEKRVLGCGLLSITLELRLRRGVGRALCRCSDRPLAPPSAISRSLALTRVFFCSQDATSSAFALPSGSHVGSQARPVLGSLPFHLIWYLCTPSTVSSSRIQSASQYVALSSVALLEPTYLTRLFAFALVELRFLLVVAITR